MRSLFANAVLLSGAESGLFAITAFLAHAPKEAPRADQPAKRIAASPRKAEIVFPWARLGIFEDLSFQATPGPGYSEGGDVFRPEETGRALPDVPRADRGVAISLPHQIGSRREAPL